jgi:tetratricopeptide (TPR) repeat protein
MLKAAAEDIGSQSDQPKPGSGWKKKAGLLGMGMAGGAVLGGSWVLGMIGKAADFLYGHGPAGRPPPTRHGALDRLREWAEKHWQQLADSRNREIERLIRLMDSDPDLGLRYALPLAGIEQSRGTARPTWKLGLNNPRYTLGHGGGAIDGWDVENDARLKLERQYREAAKREIALGRHDRAAYIYGNLLGDWTSAAQTLVNAGRHRDAVAIYLHKLHNRAAAAKCLEDAGLLLQAAAAYAEGKQYEKAGDLHAKLGNHAQARELWQAEHDALRDPLQKARLLSEKLDDLAGALELLDRTWQDGHRPSDALNAMFQIHRQADDAGAAKVLLDRMFDRRVSSMDLIAKLRLARAEAARWSDGEIKGVMEKHAFRKIAEALTAGGSDSKSLLEFLPGLDPDDRLLLRDAKRFSIRRNPPPLPKSGPLRGTLLPEQIVSLSSGIQWHSVAPLPKGASIAGYGQEMLAVGQLRENGWSGSALRTADDPGKSEVRHLTARSPRGCSRLFHFVGHRRLHYRALDRARTAADDAIGNLRGILAAGCFGDEGDFALLQYTATSSLCVHIYSETAALRRTLPIDLVPPDVTGFDWQVGGHGGHLCFAAAGFVAWRFPDGQFTTMNLGESPSSLHLSPIESEREALVVTAGNVLVIEFPKAGKAPETVHLAAADGKVAACFLPDGSIVVARRGGGCVFAPGSRLDPEATLSYPDDAGTPIAVSPRGPGGFAILTDAGKLVVFGR